MQNSFFSLQRMNTEFAQETRLLVEDVLDLGAVNMPDINERLCAYFSDTILVHLMEDVEANFKNMDRFEKKLALGFKHLKREIPDLPVPRIYTQISALNQSVVVGDSVLGISLDKYMGAEFPLYKRYYYANQRRSMSPEYIVPDCFTFYLLGQYPFPWMEGHRSLMDILLYRGKIAWIVETILDGDGDGRIALGYSSEEVDWCEEHENELWKEIERNHYAAATDPMVIRSYISSDSRLLFKGEKTPPFLGIWLGMQMVEKYMKRRPEIGIKNLLESTDCSSIMKEFN
uniref:gliding motility protein GldB-related protein n=1 Tax=Bacteroides mediterraneensis TaxID=1841856 RepID=UPI00373FCF00